MIGFGLIGSERRDFPAKTRQVTCQKSSGMVIFVADIIKPFNQAKSQTTRQTGRFRDRPACLLWDKGETE